MHAASQPPYCQRHDQFHGPLPVTVETPPVEVQRFVEGAEENDWPLEVPQVPGSEATQTDPFNPLQEGHAMVFPAEPPSKSAHVRLGLAMSFTSPVTDPEVHTG
ncbi:MAG: hypothetical protein QMC36_00665 [Patescibacteria group bacterium]